MQVLVVDDLPRARQALKSLLATDPRVTGVAVARDDQDALAQLENAPADVVIIDVAPLDTNRIATIRQIKQCWPTVRVIVLALYAESITAALSAGADAFVSKGEPASRLLSALTDRPS
ncbi:MAG TPA: response regulator transcription factor [Aggregatilineales bacterium]|nr:response regulator transcription factor [Aggregatilineales bacterium]